ncbi:MAG: excinuclease ABC subunit UvrC [Chitinophagales bacterium]|nr:excinuclease ABC subunit UvrC [Chitinophagales bacterium]
MAPDDLRNTILNLPSGPGIYRFVGDNEKVLYVGKAKNLKKRVSSYFAKRHDSARLNMLVRKIKNVEVTVVNSEQESLLLENSLIKKYKPKYNIQLKDDKSYPFIVIKNERFPRVFLTRQYIQDGSIYLGPYTSVRKAESILQLLTTIYPLRTCSLNLLQKSIEGGKFKVCLEYHIGNCMGPCQSYQSEEEYNHSIEQIKKILKGQSNVVLNELKEQMKMLADEYQFEAANDLKQKIDILQNYQAKTAVVNHSISDVDVFSIADAEEAVFINFFKIVNGSIIQTKGLELKRSELNESLEELLVFGIAEIREQLHSSSREILVPFAIDYPDEAVKITVPQIGDKRKLVQLSMKNALLLKSQYLEEQHKTVKKRGPERVLEQLQKDFRLPVLPQHIECFDNSNFQGTTPVASMVVFKNAKPSKKDYRHFNIKTVEGPNDFASMEEIVHRRYKRLLEEQSPLPQLIIIDGGKGQLSSAMKAIEGLGLVGKVSVASIAKRLEEIYFPNDPVPLHISKRSESLRLVQYIRDEAHRFAITFHRAKRTKASLKPGITVIKGVGTKTTEALLKAFRSEKKLRQASLEELASIVGLSKAKIVFEHFQAQQPSLK